MQAELVLLLITFANSFNFIIISAIFTLNQ